jgi:hypothetical protein
MISPFCDFIVVIPHHRWSRYKCHKATFNSFVEASNHESTCGQSDNETAGVVTDVSVAGSVSASTSATSVPAAAAINNKEFLVVSDATNAAPPFVDKENTPTTVTPIATPKQSSSIPMSNEKDKDELSPLHCFIRRQLSYTLDSTNNARVGITCRHCRKETQFPTSVKNVYSVARSCASRHFNDHGDNNNKTSGCCLPPKERMEYEALVKNNNTKKMKRSSSEIIMPSVLTLWD